MLDTTRTPPRRDSLLPPDTRSGAMTTTTMRPATAAPAPAAAASRRLVDTLAPSSRSLMTTAALPAPVAATRSLQQGPLGAYLRARQPATAETRGPVEVASRLPAPAQAFVEAVGAALRQAEPTATLQKAVTGFVDAPEFSLDSLDEPLKRALERQVVDVAAGRLDPRSLILALDRSGLADLLACCDGPGRLFETLAANPLPRSVSAAVRRAFREDTGEDLDALLQPIDVDTLYHGTAVGLRGARIQALGLRAGGGVFDEAFFSSGGYGGVTIYTADPPSFATAANWGAGKRWPENRAFFGDAKARAPVLAIGIDPSAVLYDAVKQAGWSRSPDTGKHNRGSGAAFVGCEPLRRFADWVQTHQQELAGLHPLAGQLATIEGDPLASAHLYQLAGIDVVRGVISSTDNVECRVVNPAVLGERELWRRSYAGDQAPPLEPSSSSSPPAVGATPAPPRQLKDELWTRDVVPPSAFLARLRTAMADDDVPAVERLVGDYNIPPFAVAHLFDQLAAARGPVWVETTLDAVGKKFPVLAEGFLLSRAAAPTAIARWSRLERGGEFINDHALFADGREQVLDRLLTALLARQTDLDPTVVADWRWKDGNPQRRADLCCALLRHPSVGTQPWVRALAEEFVRSDAGYDARPARVTELLARLPHTDAQG